MMHPSLRLLGLITLVATSAIAGAPKTGADSNTAIPCVPIVPTRKSSSEDLSKLDVTEALKNSQCGCDHTGGIFHRFRNHELPEFRGTLVSLNADATDINGQALVPVSHTKDQYLHYFAWADDGHVYIHVDNSSAPGGTRGVVFDRTVVVSDAKGGSCVAGPTRYAIDGGGESTADGVYSAKAPWPTDTGPTNYLKVIGTY
jgi:hypothetical protein